MKKVLVTGANGFIGQHLCRKLIDCGYHVKGMRHDNHPLYFLKEDELEWINADLKDKNSLTDICLGIDIVFHLAAIPRNDVSKSWEDFYLINVKGTEFLLEEAQKSIIKRFVYISTVEAAGYGDGINPRKENDSAKPNNNYGKSKLAAEVLVFNPKWKFDRTIVRLPMIYGPGTFLIVPKLFGMVKKGFYPFIGSGKIFMEFCYVGNVVEALILAATKPEAINQLFYASDERSYSIKEVIDAVGMALGKNYLPIYIPKSIAFIIGFLFEIIAKILPIPPIVSPYSKKPFFTIETVWWTTRNVNIVSTEKIKSLLGYSTRYSIFEGCKNTAQWLNAQAIN